LAFWIALRCIKRRLKKICFARRRPWRHGSQTHIHIFEAEQKAAGVELAEMRTLLEAHAPLGSFTHTVFHTLDDTGTSFEES